MSEIGTVDELLRFGGQCLGHGGSSPGQRNSNLGGGSHGLHLALLRGRVQAFTVWSLTLFRGGPAWTARPRSPPASSRTLRPPPRPSSRGGAPSSSIRIGA